MPRAEKAKSMEVPRSLARPPPTRFSEPGFFASRALRVARLSLRVSRPSKTWLGTAPAALAEVVPEGVPTQVVQGLSPAWAVGTARIQNSFDFVLTLQESIFVSCWAGTCASFPGGVIVVLCLMLVVVFSWLA